MPACLTRHVAGITLLIACLLTICGCQSTNPEATLSAIMEEATQNGIPGLSAAIADEHGIVWSGVAGKADLMQGTPIREDHLFGVGSITKTFVAVVALQLVEEERLRLDQTPLQVLGADVVGSIANTDTATVAQLLNHTSGIPSWEDDPLWIREGRGAELDVSRMWKQQDTLPYIAHAPAIDVPGNQYSYANTNHTLIGLMIEEITGNTLVHEIRKRVLAPVGLSEIYLEGFQDIPEDNMPRRYHYLTPEFVRDAGVQTGFAEVSANLIDVSTSNLSVEWAAGGIVATAGDLARYAAALRSGKLLRKDSMALMRKWFPVNNDIDVGHGVFRFKHNTGYLLGHSGNVLGFTGFMFWHEEQPVVVVMLANVGTMHIGQELPRASSVVLDSEFFEHALKLVKDERLPRNKYAPPQ